MEEAASASDPMCLEDVVVHRVAMADVTKALASLTEEQAAVVIMRFAWNLPVRDVAAVLGKTEGAVKALQHRAMRALANLLREEGGEVDGKAD